MNRKAIKNSKNRASLEFFKPRIELYSHYLRNIQKPRIFCSIRAITEATLALLIIAIITMGFLAIFVYNYGERQTCTQKIELCRTSMTLLNTFRKIYGQAFLSEPKIDCPICVPGSSDTIKTEKQEEAIHEVAEHLRWCWYKTLGNDNKMGNVGWAPHLKEKKICIVCSEFSTNQDINQAQLLQYLQKTKIRTGPGAGKTYETYLNLQLGITKILDYKFFKERQSVAHLSRDSPELQQILSQQRKLSILTQETRFQVIRYNWGQETIQLGLTGVSTIPTFNHIFLIPTSEISTFPCDVYHYQKE
ncbi:hypothetical protein HY484_01685 [Candidatus Woesearchaeota archaeon]|nr:hypothetical protein [Candidatus Woesearchaeota archaeon]